MLSSSSICFAAAAEVVVTESQPERMSPYKTVASGGI